MMNGRSANRREHFRVDAGELAVRGWRMAAHERLIDRVLPSRRLPLCPIDMGRGGLSAIVPSICLPQRGDRVNLSVPVDRDDPTDFVLVEGRVIYVLALREEECRIGLAFQPALTETLTRRFDNTMDRVLSALQRNALRRLRNNAA